MAVGKLMAGELYAMRGRHCSICRRRDIAGCCFLSGLASSGDDGGMLGKRRSGGQAGFSLVCGRE